MVRRQTVSERTKEAGFDGHLVKPVELEVLTKLLTDLLDRQPKSQQTLTHPPTIYSQFYHADSAAAATAPMD